MHADYYAQSPSTRRARDIAPLSIAVVMGVGAYDKFTLNAKQNAVYLRTNITKCSLRGGAPHSCAQIYLIAYTNLVADKHNHPREDPLADQ